MTIHGYCQLFIYPKKAPTIIMKNKIQLLFIILLLSVILIVSVNGTYEGFYGFYYEDGNYQKGFPQKLVEKLVALKPVSVFISYTGFDTGYGFFAPNVASDFILLFELKDSTGNIVESTIMPKFRNKESVIRFTTATGLFLEKVTQDSMKGKKYDSYLNVIVQQIALHLKKSNPKVSHIDVGLYLYDYSSIRKSKKEGLKESLILIETYNF